MNELIKSTAECNASSNNAVDEVVKMQENIFAKKIIVF